MDRDFRGRDFLKLADFTPDEVAYMVDTAIELKRKRAAGDPDTRCRARPSP